MIRWWRCRRARPGRCMGSRRCQLNTWNVASWAACAAALLGRAGRSGVTGEVPGLGLHGQGGIGKTVLAAAAACDPVVRAHFPDGVFWVTVGEQPDLVGLQPGLLSRLGAAGAAPRSAERGRGPAAAGAGRRQVLLVDR